MDSVVHFDKMTKVRFCNWVRFLTEFKIWDQVRGRKSTNLVCWIDQKPVQYIACRDIRAGDELVVTYRQSGRKGGDDIVKPAIVPTTTKPTNVHTSNSQHFDCAPFLQGNNSKPFLIKSA